MYRLPKWNMITDKLTSFWDQLQVTIIVMSIAFSPQTHSVHFLSTSTVLYTHVYNEYYICHLSRSHPPTHILTHFPHPPLTHIHAHTNLTPSDLHTQLINTFTDPPTHTHTHTQNHHHYTTCPLHKMATLKTFFFSFLFFSSSSKLTQSMHLDNKLDWVNQPSFQGIHFVFLLGLSLFILNIKYLKLS